MSDKFIARGRFHVDFPLSSIDRDSVRFMSAEIRQHIKRHDIAILRMRATSVDWFNVFYDGAPVEISYSGEDQSTGVFVGYVNKIKPTLSDDAKFYERDVICVAASHVTRETARRTFRNKTDPEIVQEIGKKIGFNVVTKQHGLRKPITVMSGETYWAFMARLAKRSGYVLRVEGTCIYFLPLPDMAKAFLSRAPFLTDVSRREPDGFVPKTIHDLSAWVGSSSDDEENSSDEVVVSGMNPETGEVYEETVRPSSALYRRESLSPHVRYPKGLVAHSRAEARLMAKGAADAGAMAFDLKMTVSGTALLQPYHPVKVDSKEHTTNGVLLTKSVVHRFTEDRFYTCDLVASTDSIDGQDNTPKSRAAVRDVATELAQGFAPDAVTASRLKITRVAAGGSPGLVKGIWVSR